MSKATLSPAASAVFKSHLRGLRTKESMSLPQVARVLSCCRRTAWALLNPDNKSRVRTKFAVALSRRMGIEGASPWDRTNMSTVGVRPILKAWAAARDPAARRRVAWRLAAFISEAAVMHHHLVVRTTVTTTALFEPASLSLDITPPRTRARCNLTITFDPQHRQDLDASFTDLHGNEIFNGLLTQYALKRLLIKARSWQPKAPH